MHAHECILTCLRNDYSSRRFEGPREMVLVSKSYLDVAGHPSWGWRARHGSEMIQQILSIDAGSCRRRRVFTGGLPGRVPPAAAASLGSGCELAPRRGHLRDGRPLIGLIGVRWPRFFSAVCCNWDRSRMYHGASTYISTGKHVEKRAYGSGLYHTKPVLLIAILRPSIAPRPSWLESNCLQR